MNKAQIFNYVHENYPDEEIVLFDGLEDAFIGIAQRFEPVAVQESPFFTSTKGGVHRFFAVYSYSKIIEDYVSAGMNHDEAAEYFSYNVIGTYAGENTPAILMDEIDGTGYL